MWPVSLAIVESVIGVLNGVAAFRRGWRNKMPEQIDRPIKLPAKPAGTTVFKINPATWDSHSVNAASHYVDQIFCYVRRGQRVVVDFGQCFGMTEAFMREMLTRFMLVLKERVTEFICIVASEVDTRRVISKVLVDMSDGSKKTYRVGKNGVYRNARGS